MTEQHPNFHQSLIHGCQEVSPFLVGSIQAPTNDMLSFGKANHDFFQTLYLSIKQEKPEAGHSYWLTRTWDSVVWQPIYVAFVSVYGFRTIPDLLQFGQSQRNALVSGFCFADETHHHGEIPDLITQIGQQLTALLESYRTTMDELFRCRPGFTRQLLIDLIIRTATRLAQFAPEFTLQDVQQQAFMWLAALGLPTERVSLITQTDSGFFYIRKSCCLVYKTEAGKLCDDCPRAHQD
ncbi:siderophore ferric iron reductase [Vibrio sp. SCSIO 43136]|uniref:siderophore ferric iron reductase n=1 Tax=Vibrio sp. SCSIO 43136 TaxID=2819101 RepID=UPI00207560D4|nr:siderophore ferric iron reductase [Vibrio sp. SCSIO 43136]USD66050.1 siderophore ferric iron reductase [Vibrio sp. SCSIO 43136]